jgi:membrane peptidoglycan carboxypeptidase
MVSNNDEPPARPRPAWARGTTGSHKTVTGEGLFARIRTGEWPIVKIDLTEAYANVRSRAKTLRRRRIISSVLATAVLVALGTVLGTYYVSAIPLPAAVDLPATTTVYYADGTTVMARLGTQRRILVPGETLPSYVGRAVVAAEDPAYWLGSGTLISRQYARAATSVDGSSTGGQARLLVMSWKLEDTYTKDQILEFYLNTVYFGRGSWGIEAAARSYFDVHAADLTPAQAIVLAGLISSPGDGRYDPSIDPTQARQRFTAVTQRMVAMGALDQATALRLTVPTVVSYNPAEFASSLDQPTGLVVNQVLAELRQLEPFRGKPPGYLEDGGYTIVTTIDQRAQRLLEDTVDDTVTGSLMHGQPGNLQAAAVAVAPGTGRVLAYFGGHNGTGADYAGTYVGADGKVTGFGAHPPGQTMSVYTLAAALDEGISVRSRWDAPSVKEFPASGRTAENPVRDTLDAPCQPACTLADAAVGSLIVPYFALTERIGAGAVIDMARRAGVDAMWLPARSGTPARRFDLTETPVAALTPAPFGTDVALGDYPVTVLDQANAMATFADGGRRSPAHFVLRVAKDFTTVYAEAAPTTGEAVLARAAVDDLTWTLSQNPAGALPGGRPSAALTGFGRLRTSAVDNAHAWAVGFTGNLAFAVWIGNEDTEFPLRDKLGDRVTGTGLPAEIYRTFVGGASDRLGLPRVDFATPTFTGNADIGDAR